MFQSCNPKHNLSKLNTILEMFLANHTFQSTMGTTSKYYADPWLQKWYLYVFIYLYLFHTKNWLEVIIYHFYYSDLSYFTLCCIWVFWTVWPWPYKRLTMECTIYLYQYLYQICKITPNEGGIFNFLFKNLGCIIYVCQSINLVCHGS